MCNEDRLCLVEAWLLEHNRQIWITLNQSFLQIHWACFCFQVFVWYAGMQTLNCGVVASSVFLTKALSQKLCLVLSEYLVSFWAGRVWCQRRTGRHHSFQRIHRHEHSGWGNEQANFSGCDGKGRAFFGGIAKKENSIKNCDRWFNNHCACLYNWSWTVGLRRRHVMPTCWWLTNTQSSLIFSNFLLLKYSCSGLLKLLGLVKIVA